MPKKKKPIPRIAGAKLAMPYEESMLTPINIEINGFLYTSSGHSRLDSLAEAVCAHVEEDREFKENITLIQEGFYNEVLYAPAALCLLGFIDKGDLYNLLVGEVIDGFKDENSE